MPGIERLELGKFLGVGLDSVRKLEQQVASVHRRHARPAREGFARSLDRPVDVGLLGLRDFGDQRVVVRVQDRDARTRLRVDELTIDE